MLLRYSSVGAVSGSLYSVQCFPLHPELLSLHSTPRLLRVIPAPPTILQTHYHIFATYPYSLSSFFPLSVITPAMDYSPKNAGLSGSRTQHIIFIFYTSVAISFYYLSTRNLYVFLSSNINLVSHSCSSSKVPCNFRFHSVPFLL